MASSGQQITDPMEKVVSQTNEHGTYKIFLWQSDLRYCVLRLPHQYKILAHSIPAPEFKVVLVGDGGVGKRTYLTRYELRGAICYLGTIYIDADVTIDRFCYLLHQSGPIIFNVWLAQAGDAYGGLRDRWYQQAQGAVLMFDVTSRITYENIPNGHRNLMRVCENIPVVLCGNKAEIKDRKVKMKQITQSIQKENMQYCDISRNWDYNLEKPFLWLSRKWSGDNNLYLCAAPTTWEQVTRVLAEDDNLRGNKLVELLAELPFSWKFELFRLNIVAFPAFCSDTSRSCSTKSCSWREWIIICEP